MKGLGIVAVLSSLALAVLAEVRKVEWAGPGTVLSNRYWIVDGPKGENSPEPLPEDLTAVAEEGDMIQSTCVWCPDLQLSYERLEVVRGGRTVAAVAPRRVRYFLFLGSAIVSPLALWGLALLVSTVVPRRKEARP